MEEQFFDIRAQLDALGSQIAALKEDIPSSDKFFKSKVQSDSLDKFLPAFHTAQKAMPIIRKNKVGQTGRGSYEYADIEAVMPAVMGCLSDHDMTMMQQALWHENQSWLWTRIFHVGSGQWMGSVFPIVPEQHNNLKALGSAITYIRRYASLLMVQAGKGEDDDDERKPLRTDVRTKAILKSVEQAAKKETPQALRECLAKIPSMDNIEQLDRVSAWAKRKLQPDEQETVKRALTERFAQLSKREAQAAQTGAEAG